MKKLLAVTTATLAGVLLAAPLARASIVNPLTFNAAVSAAQAVDPTLAPPANDGKHDFAVGGFEGIEMERVGFSAQSGPQGQAPSGHVSGTFAKGEKLRFKVACLEVEGNKARIGIVPSEAPPSNAAAKEGASLCRRRRAGTRGRRVCVHRRRSMWLHPQGRPSRPDH